MAAKSCFRMLEPGLGPLLLTGHHFLSRGSLPSTASTSSLERFNLLCVSNEARLKGSLRAAAILARSILLFEKLANSDCKVRVLVRSFCRSSFCVFVGLVLVGLLLCGFWFR